MGYITRVDPHNDHEARVYKGHTPVTEVATFPLEFLVDDKMKNGTILHVSYPTFNVETQSYGEPKERPYWISNLNPVAVREINYQVVH